MPAYKRGVEGRTSFMVDKGLYEAAANVSESIGLPITTAVALYLEEIARFGKVSDLRKAVGGVPAKTMTGETMTLTVGVSARTRDAVKAAAAAAGIPMTKAVSDYLCFIVAKGRVPLTLCTDEKQAGANLRRQHVEYYSTDL